MSPPRPRGDGREFGDGHYFTAVMMVLIGLAASSCSRARLLEETPPDVDLVPAMVTFLPQEMVLELSSAVGMLHGQIFLRFPATVWTTQDGTMVNLPEAEVKLAVDEVVLSRPDEGDRIAVKLNRGKLSTEMTLLVKESFRGWQHCRLVLTMEPGEEHLLLGAGPSGLSVAHVSAGERELVLDEAMECLSRRELESVIPGVVLEAMGRALTDFGNEVASTLQETMTLGMEGGVVLTPEPGAGSGRMSLGLSWEGGTLIGPLPNQSWSDDGLSWVIHGWTTAEETAGCRLSEEMPERARSPAGLPEIPATLPDGSTYRIAQAMRTDFLHDILRACAVSGLLCLSQDVSGELLLDDLRHWLPEKLLPGTPERGMVRLVPGRSPRVELGDPNHPVVLALPDWEIGLYLEVEEALARVVGIRGDLELRGIIEADRESGLQVKWSAGKASNVTLTGLQVDSQSASQNTLLLGPSVLEALSASNLSPAPSWPDHKMRMVGWRMMEDHLVIFWR